MKLNIDMLRLVRCNVGLGYWGEIVVSGQFVMMFVYSVVIFFVVNVLVN